MTVAFWQNNSQFLLEYRLYVQHRKSMLNKLQDLQMISTDFHLYRDYNLTFEQNMIVFYRNYVHQLLFVILKKFSSP